MLPTDQTNPGTAGVSRAEPARPAVLFFAGGGPAERWAAPLRAELPGIDLRVWPDVGDKAAIEAVILWKQRAPERFLAELPNLKAALILGAGVDYLIGDPSLPPGLPVGRLVDPRQVRGISEFVLASVLGIHRDFLHFQRAKLRHEWDYRHPEVPEGRRVGFMGFGNMVRESGEMLRRLGFPLALWTRRPRSEDGYSCFHGAAQLAAFLSRTDILVVTLPMTEATRGIINEVTLELLPHGASIINIGRGELVDDLALVRALDRGRVAEAVLDVFHVEPLPEDHPFWRHPRIMITTHIAGAPHPSTAAPQLAEDVRRALRGEPPQHPVDRAAGY